MWVHPRNMQSAREEYGLFNMLYQFYQCLDFAGLRHTMVRFCCYRLD